MGLDVRTALALVGVEQTIPCIPAKNRLELPNKIDAVPDAGAHALPEKGVPCANPRVASSGVIQRKINRQMLSGFAMLAASSPTAAHALDD
jgi:hypothetical protein